MKREEKPSLPKTLPEYSITWKEEAPFSVECEEMTGWFIVPHPGEKCVWGMYDLPSRKLDIAYDMAVTSGKGGYFKPNDVCTRGEAVSFISRTIE